jgi:hypothetical protein
VLEAKGDGKRGRGAPQGHRDNLATDSNNEKCMKAAIHEQLFFANTDADVSLLDEMLY